MEGSNFITPIADTTLNCEEKDSLNPQVENGLKSFQMSSKEETSSSGVTLNFNVEISNLQSNEGSNSVGSTQSTTTNLVEEEQTESEHVNSLIGGTKDVEDPQENVLQKFCVEHSNPDLVTSHTHGRMRVTPIKELPPYLTVVSREQWRAIPPRRTIPKTHPSHIVVFTYATDSKECFTPHKCERVVRKLQRFHMRVGLPDIPYSFMVGGDGRIYEGRGWFSNSRTLMQLTEVKGCLIEIAFLGNYKVERPSEAMFDAALELIEYGRQNQWIQEEFGLYENYEGPQITPVILDDVE